MAKQYAEPAAYEAKLEKVMARLGVEVTTTIGAALPVG